MWATENCSPDGEAAKTRVSARHSARMQRDTTKLAPRAGRAAAVRGRRAREACVLVRQRTRMNALPSHLLRYSSSQNDRMTTLYVVSQITTNRATSFKPQRYEIPSPLARLVFFDSLHNPWKGVKLMAAGPRWPSRARSLSIPALRHCTLRCLYSSAASYSSS